MWCTVVSTVHYGGTAVLSIWLTYLYKYEYCILWDQNKKFRLNIIIFSLLFSTRQIFSRISDSVISYWQRYTLVSGCSTSGFRSMGDSEEHRASDESLASVYRQPIFKQSRKSAILRSQHIESEVEKPFPFPREELQLRGLLLDSNVYLYDRTSYDFLKFRRVSEWLTCDCCEY